MKDTEVKEKKYQIIYADPPWKQTKGGIRKCRPQHARLIWDKTNGVAPAFTVRFSHEYLLWFYTGTFLKIAEQQLKLAQ